MTNVYVQGFLTLSSCKRDLEDVKSLLWTGQGVIHVQKTFNIKHNKSPEILFTKCSMTVDASLTQVETSMHVRPLYFFLLKHPFDLDIS